MFLRHALVGIGWTADSVPRSDINTCEILATDLHGNRYRITVTLCEK